MNYNDYKVSRNLAWEILLNENITALPVNVSALCTSLGIRLQPYDGDVAGVDNDGEAIIMPDGVPLIVYNKQKSRPRKRFTVAHEIGHILLGHVGKYQLVNRDPSSKDDPIEQAANVFASRLLAPACVLWALNAHAPEEIMKLCDISYQAAEYRAARMKELCCRNMFLASPLEREVYNQFLPFIESKRN